MGFALLLVPLFILLFGRYLSTKIEYKCSKCGCEFKISTTATLLTLQQVYFRLLKCPKCGENSWCRIVRYKDREVIAKVRQIDEKTKTNHTVLLFVLILTYLTYIAIWILKPNYLLLAVVTAIFVYFAAIVVYAARNGYNSSLYLILIFVSVLLIGIIVFVQSIVILTSG
jgi:DNA-directed RNA polymerase subunit RPC12/RpoP